MYKKRRSSEKLKEQYEETNIVADDNDSVIEMSNGFVANMSFDEVQSP